MNNVSQVYKGYEYQIDVSVWFALHMMLEKQEVEYIEVEPASMEDIEAELSTNSDKSEVFTFSPSNKLIIQIKSKSNGPWTVSEISNVLLNSNKTTSNRALRTSPVQMMERNKNSVYVFITDADVSKDLRQFCVIQIGEPSKAKGFPTSIENKLNLNSEIASRFSILSKFTWDYTKMLSIDIISRCGNVPMQLSVDCRQEIAESIRVRLLGKAYKRFTRKDLEDVLKKFQGLPQSCFFLNYHVVPRNYNRAVEILKKYNALLIYGEPGVGKSLLAEALVNQYKKKEIPYMVITESDMPRGVAVAFDTGMSVIAYLDDPWGKINPGQFVNEWRNSIVSLLRRTREDKKIIIVSRESVLESIYPLDSQPEELKRVAFKIDKNSYSEKDRIEMIQKRIDCMSNCNLNKRKFIRDHMGALLESLVYPVELIAAVERICEQLPKNHKELKLVITKCNQENLIQTYVDELCSRPYSQRLAVILAWILTRISPKTWEADCTIFRDWIFQSNINTCDGLPLDKTITNLLKIGWLKIDEYHGLYLRDPRIEKAINDFFVSNLDECRDVMNIIFDNLSKNNRIKDALRMIEGLTTRKLRPADNIIETLDNWLISNALSCELDQFPMAFRALGNWHVKDEPWAIFARLFYKSQIKNERAVVKNALMARMIFFDDLPIDDIEKIKSCLKTKKLAERVLIGFFSWHYLEFELSSVIDKYNEFEWRFPEACFKGIESITNGKQNDLLALPTFGHGLKLWGSEFQLTKALEYCLQEYDNISNWYKTWSNDYGKKIGEGIYDAGYEAHLLEEPGERFLPIQETLGILVGGLVLRKGSSYLEYLASKKELLDSCFEAFEENTDIFNDEVFEKCLSYAWEPSTRKKAWNAVGKAKLYHKTPMLVNALEASHIEEVRGALEGLAKLYSVDEFGVFIDKKMEELSFVSKCRLVEAASEYFEGPERYISPEDYRSRIIIQYSETERDLLNKIPVNNESFFDISNRWKSLSNDDQEKILLLARTNDIDVSKRAIIFAACGHDNRVLPLIKNWDANINDNRTRLINLMALFQFPDELSNTLKIALKDEYYGCRKFALEKVSMVADEDPTLKQKIIDLARNDPSALVRETCLKIIGKYIWPEGISVLLDMLKDRRNKSELPELPEHHVARTAALQLESFDKYEFELIQPLFDFLLSGEKGQPDIFVHLYVILCLRDWTGNQTVVEFLEKLLSDNWYVSANKGSGYIRRFAAAWALVGAGKVLPFEKLTHYISDPDDRIAGPFMIALADYGDLGVAYLNKMIQTDDETVPKNRKILAVGLLFVRQEKKFLDLAESLFQDTPLGRILNKIKDSFDLLGKIPLREWMEINFVDFKPEKMLDELNDIQPAFYYIMEILIGSEWNDVYKLNFLDVINKTMPENIKIISSRSFLGYE